jgi:acetylornithine deacetylase/succinyl-diaminopimelate desuccinylase-like protein
MTPAEKLLRELIALPSVNPAFIPATDSRAGEGRVADFLTATAASAKLDVEQRPVFPQRNNVIIRLMPANKPKARVFLAPHMDTVGNAQMADSLFVPTKRGDRLHGRGACDTKGSIAAMLTALTAVASSPVRPAKTEIVLTALIDEENGQWGSRALIKEGWRGDLAIVGEPTRLHVITAHKGDVWLTLRTRGKAAHSSRPDLGRNAIHEMAKIVDLLQTRYATALGKRRHPVLGPPTVSVGMIRGGTQPNIVPDQCEIVVDRRTIPGESNESVRREIRALLAQNGLRAEMVDQKGAAPCWPMATDATAPLVQRFMQSIGQRKPEGVHYFSDAAVFAQGGTPAVLFGPGDIAQAHTADEWSSLRSLERATLALQKFLQSLP